MLLAFRPRGFGFTGTLFPYSLHQVASAAIVGPSALALAVISYSTRGGTSAKTVREIRPSFSSSRSCAVSMCCVIPLIANAQAELGYSASHLVPLMIVVKVLGPATILWCFNVALSDLAYVGMFYHLLLSALAHLGVRKPKGFLPAVVALILLAASFMTQNAIKDALACLVFFMRCSPMQPAPAWQSVQPGRQAQPPRPAMRRSTRRLRDSRSSQTPARQRLHPRQWPVE